MHFIILIIIICNFLTVLFPMKILGNLYPTNLTLHFYLKSAKLLYIYKFYKAVVNVKTQTRINGCRSKFIVPHLYCSGIYCAHLWCEECFSSAIMLKTYVLFQIWVQFSSLFVIINKRLLWNPWLPTAMENNIANLFAAVSESVKWIATINCKQTDA